MIPTSIFAYDLGGVIAVVIWASPYLLIEKLWGKGKLRYFALYVICIWAMAILVGALIAGTLLDFRVPWP